MRQRNVQIEEKEVENVTVKKTVRQVAKHSGEEKAEGNITPGIARVMPYQQSHHHNQSH